MFEGPFMRYIKQSPFIGDRWSGIIFLEVYVLGKTARSIPTPRFQEAPDRGLIDSESLTPGVTKPHPRDCTHRIGPLLLCNTCFILDMHVAWHVLSWRNLTEILFIDITDAIQYTCNRLYNTDTNGESAQSWAVFPLVLSFYVKRTHTAGVSTAVICLDLMWPYYWFFVTNLYK